MIQSGRGALSSLTGWGRNHRCVYYYEEGTDDETPAQPLFPPTYQADAHHTIATRGTPNQTLQPTPSRLVSSLFMTKILSEIAIRALASRG